MNTFPFGVDLSSSWLLVVLEFVFIGLVLALILGFLRLIFRSEKNGKDQGQGMTGVESPLQALQLRLARGEISKEKYEELKQVLQDE